MMRSSYTPIASWSTVLILFGLSTVAWMDRSVISMVIGPIKQHFGIGDSQVGLLAGFAFIFFYILLLIPIGKLADRYSRRWILFLGVSTWSVATFFCGIAGSYSQLFAARMLVGAGEGTVSPVAASVIGGVFGRARLAAPMSLFSLGTSAGTAAGAIAAGYILGWGGKTGVIDLPLIGAVEPWQLVFILLGLPGAIAAFLGFAIIDPPRAAVSPSPASPEPTSGAKPSSARYIKANWRTFGCIIPGFVAVNVAVTSILTWSPEYLRRAFSMPSTKTGWSIGFVSLVAPLVCQAGVGFVANRLIARGMLDAPLRIMRWLLIASLPLAAMLWWAPSAPLYITAFFFLAVVLFPSNPLASTTVQMLSPEPIRGELAAIQLAFLGVVGIGFGSSIVAFLSQYVLGENHLNAAMGVVVLASSSFSLLLLSHGMKPMRATIRALDEPLNATRKG
jgi:MFS family permease